MTFLLIIVILAGLYMTWNIGANDVANAIGTSVGSGAIRLREAVILAAVLEFCGAYFFGSHVSETIESQLIKTELFRANPDVLIHGMLAVLLGAGSWLLVASYYGLPVSTTHSIVGAMVGFGISAGGFSYVYWNNILSIASSWVLSPLVGGCVSYSVFTLMRRNIFYARNPQRAVRRVAPFIVFVYVFIFLGVFLYQDLTGFKIGRVAIYAIIAALLAGGLAKIFLPNPPQKDDQFDYVEKTFAKLQILSAALMAFAHGANDVANAIGPLTIAVSALMPDVPSLKGSLLALGGFGIVVGLATWGWRVIETIGRRITELTPSRGFAAEFGAATTILLASRLGFPISATHTLVGAVLGVGFARGMGALNLNTIRDIATSWVITIPVGAITTVLIYQVIAQIS